MDTIFTTLVNAGNGPSSATAVGFTHQGLRALGVPRNSLASFAPEFRQGMAASAAELGDVGDSSPDHWEKPLGSPEVHVALSLLSPDAAQREILLDRARRAHEELTGVQVKPIFTAVNGIAYGGGCELAQSTDFIIASDNTVFGQPEAMLAEVPGPSMPRVNRGG
jgi:hypothetical protein